MANSLLPPHGNYKRLLSYRKAVIIYDGTTCFCSRFLERFDRTVDQMIQAARSGKQNIIEGCVASGTSKETEIKLLNVARGSLEELLEDFVDFLRTRDDPQWSKDSPEAQYVRKLGANPKSSVDTFRPFYTTRSAATTANILICLIHQASYLLDKQIRRLEKDFLKNGGLRERMTRARLESRKKQSQ